MAVVVYEDGVEHRFAPNPKLQGENWGEEYPPIKTNAKWLINKYTGEIVPNQEDFAKRSDILEPYLGELPADGVVSETERSVNNALSQPADDGELDDL